MDDRETLVGVLIFRIRKAWRVYHAERGHMEGNLLVRVKRPGRLICCQCISE